MAIVRTDVIEGYYKLCVEKAVQLGRIDFIVKGGLICEEVVEAIDISGNVQFRFIPPTVRISTEHWEFAGELHLSEKEAGVARGALVWLEHVSDYLCLATAGAPVKMEPFREILTEAHALPVSHPRQVWYDEVKVGRVVTQDMLTRANTFMWISQSQIPSNLLNPYGRALWWFRHGANIEIESPALAYTCFFNSLETLLRYEKGNKNRGKPTKNNRTKKQFLFIFGNEIGNELYKLCYGMKDQSLYDLRNDIDHGIIVELGSGMLRVLGGLNLLKAIVVDLALYWIKQNETVGGWLSKGVLDNASDGLIMLSADEAQKIFGVQTAGPITLPTEYEEQSVMSRKKVHSNDLDPKSLSVQYEKQVARFGGIAHTSTMQIYFKDGSRLDFEANSTNPNPRTIGGEGSVAHLFASNVKQFSLESQKKVISLVFKDDSKWDLDISSFTH